MVFPTGPGREARKTPPPAGMRPLLRRRRGPRQDAEGQPRCKYTTCGMDAACLSEAMANPAAYATEWGDSGVAYSTHWPLATRKRW